MLQVNAGRVDDGVARIDAGSAPSLPLSLYANRLRALKYLALGLGFVGLGCYYMIHPPQLRHDLVTEEWIGAFVVLAFP